MGKVDKLRIAHRDRQTHEWYADKMPSKDVKRAKVKERQYAKKTIRRELKDVE